MLLGYMLALLKEAPSHPTLLLALTAGGQLAFAAAAIFGEALSDLLKRSASKNIKHSVGGFCVLGLIFSVGLFMAIQATPETALNRNYMIEASYQCFQISLLFGLICKILAKS